MRLIKQLPRGNNVEFQRRIDQLLSELMEFQQPMMQFSDKTWHPAVDVFETEQGIVVLVELPGVDLNKVEVVLHGEVLYISGERFLAAMPCFRRYQLEIPTGSFERAVRLPRPVHPDHVEASYKDGILTIQCGLARPEVIEIR